MDLTAEQIDRQPFRMRKRGYDIMQVRNFLREVAQEMRHRDTGVGTSPGDAEARADRIVADAETRAQLIVEDAEAAARIRSDEVLGETQVRLDELFAQESEVHHRLQHTLDELEDITNQSDDDADVIELSREPETTADSSLADFMKAALRNEVRQD